MATPPSVRHRAARATAAAVGLLALAGGMRAVAAAPAAAATARQPATVARAARSAHRRPSAAHRMNLRAAYERALPQARLGKVAGIVYARGRQPASARRSAVTGPSPAAGPASASGQAAGAPGAATCAEPDCPLTYQGGPVQQSPAVYLLLWGPHWETSRGQAASARYLERFYRGLSVAPQDTWSAITSQYAGGNGFPGFGTSVFMGTYADTSTPPHGVTQRQLTAEANAFAASRGLAGHVGVQIVIATQSRTCPAGFYSPRVCGRGHRSASDYCGWHSSSPGTGVTFTNLPYLLNAGTGCGKDIVRSKYDGFSIVGGHEYAESITDPVPPTGWIDTSDPTGGEVADKCAWVDPVTGKLDIHTVRLSSGRFAMQPLFSNARLLTTNDGCTMSAAVTASAVTVTDPGRQTTISGTSVSLQIQASTGPGTAVSYRAIGLPEGLSISSSTGLITGTPATPVSTTVKIIAADSAGASGSAIFSWKVVPPCRPAQLLRNRGFERGRLAPWKATSGVLTHSSRRHRARSGRWLARLGGRRTRHTSRLSQKVRMPAACTSATFSFWLEIRNHAPHRRAAYGTLTVRVLATDGKVLATLRTYSNREAGRRYRHYSFPVSSLAGRKVVVEFTGRQRLRRHGTSFLIDDTALKVS